MWLQAWGAANCTWNRRQVGTQRSTGSIASRLPACGEGYGEGGQRVSWRASAGVMFKGMREGCRRKCSMLSSRNSTETDTRSEETESCSPAVSSEGSGSAWGGGFLKHFGQTGWLLPVAVLVTVSTPKPQRGQRCPCVARSPIPGSQWSSAHRPQCSTLCSARLRRGRGGVKSSVRSGRGV